MKQRITTGFKAGFIGALILILIMFILQAVHISGRPGFVEIYEFTFHVQAGTPGVFAAALLFALSGGIWGAIFHVLFKPGILNGILYGLLPSLWLWLIIQPYLDRPVFGGFAWKAIVFPLIFNCLIWGSFVGWYVNRRNHVIR